MRLLATLAIVASVSIPHSAFAQEDTGRPIAVVVRPLYGDQQHASVARELTRLRGQRFDEVPFSLTVSGVDCDERRLSPDRREREPIRALRALATKRPVLLTTYADTRLTDLSSEEITDEIRTGRDAITECTGVRPRGPFVPPGLSVPDDDSVRALEGAGVLSALSAFAVPPIEERPRIIPAVSWNDVDDLLDARPETRELVVVLPADSRVLARLADDERFDIRPMRGFRDVDVVRGVIDNFQPLPDDYVEALGTTVTRVERFLGFAVSDSENAMVRTALARARATAGRWTTLMDNLRRVGGSVAAAFDRVSVAPGTVTFASSRGSIPVTVSNKNSYPVRVRIGVSSAKLDFDEPSQVVEIAPPGDTVTFAAVARSTGSFPTRVVVSTTDGDVELDRAEFTVRSVAANLPALVLTAGAAIFLFVWTIRRLRRRNGKAEAT